MAIEIDGWRLSEETAAGDKNIRQAERVDAFSFIRRNADDSIVFSAGSVAELPPSVARWLTAPKGAPVGG